MRIFFSQNIKVKIGTIIFFSLFTFLSKADSSFDDYLNTLTLIESKVDVLDEQVGLALECCTDSASTITTIDSLVDSIETTLETCCTTTPVQNSDQESDVITLSAVGNYVFIENIIYPIVISSDDVCLNLDCRKTSTNDGSLDMITVNSNLSRISIYGGDIVNTDSPTGSGSGVLINEGCSNIRLENLSVTGCANGIQFAGIDGNEITGCSIESCDFISNTTGVTFDRADENTITDCSAIHSTQAGFALEHSESNCFYDCQALKTSGSQSTIGFFSDSGKTNLFERCVAKETQTTAVDFCNKAHGFLLTGTEERTKIIECVVNDTDMTSTVSAVAYGIQLAPVLLDDADLLVEVASDNTPTGFVQSVAWSPDMRYIASGDWGDYIRIFRFENSQLDHTASSTFTLGGDVNSVAWSPDGRYIASGDDGDYVHVFSFDGSQVELITTSSFSLGGNVLSVAWSPDGKYIASGEVGLPGNGFVRAFCFDGSSLENVANSNTTSGNVFSVGWSPDGKYIASGDTGGYLRVFNFNGSALTLVDADNTPAATVRFVSWSPNGAHIAVAVSSSVQVYSFDGSNINLIDSNNTPTSTVNSVTWSPDGKHIASGDNNNYVRVFSFDGSDIMHTKGVTTPGSAVLSVDWSSDGKHIASGDIGTYVRVFTAMNAPQNCTIKECTVCDTNAYGQFVGTGIAGGGNNTFLQNACCNNEVNFTYGVPNVFYGEHNLQRETVKPFDNISMPTTYANVTTLAQIFDSCSTASSTLSSIDTTLTTLAPLFAKLEVCYGGTQVENSDAVSGTITLSTAGGKYCLVEDITNLIAITNNRICLDLNCYQVASTDGGANIIRVNNNLKRVKIHGGDVVNTYATTNTGSGILVEEGCSNIRIEDISVTGCGKGINLAGVDGNEILACSIKQCDFISNTTGLVLERADQNIVNECAAIDNTQAGFELIHSEGNCLYDCQAIGTSGTQSTMGFMSDSGKTNLFKGCTAKNTQTSGEDFYTKACGFLLTGTESKTKIIDCVVNDTDMTSTVSAVSYGIQLDPVILPTSELLTWIDSDDTSTGLIYSVGWSPDGRYFASGDNSNYLLVFSFDGHQIDNIASNSSHSNIIRALSWSPDGKYIATASDDDTIRVFSFDGSEITPIDVSPSLEVNVPAIAWSPDGKYIASGDAGPTIRVFGFDGSTLTQIDESSPSESIQSITWSPDGKYIATAEWTNAYIRVYSFNGSTLNLIDSKSPVAGAWGLTVAWSPNGTHLALGTGSTLNAVSVYSFDGANLALIDSDTSATARVYTVAWSPDGHYFVSGDMDNFIRVYKFNGSNVTQIKATTNPPLNDPRGIAWSPDGQYILSGDYSNYIDVFSAMYPLENCLIDNCKVCDTNAYGQFVGTGIAGGGTNASFINNACCSNEANFTYGIPNVFYGNFNIQRDTVKPFDNISKPTTQ